MAQAKGMEKLAAGRYFIRYKDQRVALVTKKGNEWEAMHFGTHPRRVLYPSLSAANVEIIGQKLADATAALVAQYVSKEETQERS